MPFRPTASTIARRKAAFEKLQITPEKMRLQPPITSQLRMLAKRMKRRNLPASPLYYLKASASDAARKILDLYYSLPRDQRNLVPLEGYALAACELSTHVLDIITQSVAMFSRQQSAIIAAANHPSVVDKTVEMALTDEGIEDRNVLHKAMGFLPSPRGPSTIVNVAANASAKAESSPQIAVVAPPPEQTIRRLVDRFNEGPRAALPAAMPAPTYADAPTRDAQLVMVDDPEDDE